MAGREQRGEDDKRESSWVSLRPGTGQTSLCQDKRESDTNTSTAHSSITGQWKWEIIIRRVLLWMIRSLTAINLMHLICIHILQLSHNYLNFSKNYKNVEIHFLIDAPTQRKCSNFWNSIIKFYNSRIPSTIMLRTAREEKNLSSVFTTFLTSGTGR